MSDHRAVILAGGKGTRLHPYTTDTPKPLVPVGKTAVIELLIGRLRRSGISDLHLAVNHQAEKIELHLGDGSKFGVNILYHHESQNLSTAAPVKRIENLPDQFLVINGDILTDLDFAELLSSHKKSGALLTVATRLRKDVIDYGVLHADGNGRITSFEEKPTVEHRVSMGVYVFSRSILEFIPENLPFGFDQLILSLLDAGKSVVSFDYQGFWMDIGRIEDYEKANREAEKICALLND